MKSVANKQIKKIQYRSSERQLLVNILIVAMVGIFTGFLIGMWFVANKVDDSMYDGLTEAMLVDNVVLIKEEANGKTPTQLGGVKSAVLAFDTTFNYPVVQVEGTGAVVAMGVNQAIKSKTVRLNDKIFLEKVRVSSFVKAADRFYLENNSIKGVKGNVSGSTVTWNGKTSTLSPEEYESLMGGNLNEYTKLIVSSKTAVSSTEVKEENGCYTFTLTLDKVKSVINYVKSMKETGGLSAYPVFNTNIELQLTIDSNYKLIKLVSKENYTAKMGPINAKSSGTLTNTFTYDGDFVIPEVSQNSSL